MPVQPTYPGVYVEEIPSGVRTIAGVPTAIAAFVGRTKWGPLNEPTIINNNGDFERSFGGLWVESPLTYCVRDFFQNGGGQAIIVRVYRELGGDDGIATGDVGGLAVSALGPGSWANELTVVVDHTGAADGVYNLNVNDAAGGTLERFTNLNNDDTLRRVDRVLARQSDYISVAAPADGTPETADGSQATLAGGTDGDSLDDASYTGTSKEGLTALDKADIFNLLSIPPDTREGDTSSVVYQAALAYCKKRRAMLLVDPPNAWDDPASVIAGLSGLGLAGSDSTNAALYFPRFKQSDSLRDGEIQTVVPSGAIAGVIARTDGERGIWKAPAGLDASISGIQGLDVRLTDDENGQLNPIAVNCIRTFPLSGRVIWGARTMDGSDQAGSEWKYLSIRRLALYIEESLFRGSKWVVFEPNDEPLWAQIRLNVGTFMNTLFRQGAFQGQSTKEAYFVKCDAEVNPQADINRGIVNIIVGFAPLKPAEFVIIKIQQIAGDL